MLVFRISDSSVDFSRVLNSKSQIQIRFSALSEGDNCDLDFVQLKVTSDDEHRPSSVTARSPPASFVLKMLILAKSMTTQGCVQFTPMCI